MTVRTFDPDNTMTQDLLSLERGGYALAERVTGIKRGTLYALVARNKIPHRRVSSRIVIFDRRDLEAWMDESTARLGGGL